MKPYAFNLRKINEAKRGLTKAVNEQATKKDIRRWARLLESNSKLLVELLTEQILDEGKLPQGDLFAEGISGKSKTDKTFSGSGKEPDENIIFRSGAEIKFKEDNSITGIKKICDTYDYPEVIINSSTGLPNSGSTSDNTGDSEKRQGSDTY